MITKQMKCSIPVKASIFIDCQHDTNSHHLVAMTAGAEGQCDASMSPKQIQKNMYIWVMKTQTQFQVQCKGNEGAQYRITVYLLKDDDTEDQCALEAFRDCGDSFLFQEFKSKLFLLMIDSNSINYEKAPEFAMEHGFLASDVCDLPQLDDDDILSETEDLLTPLSANDSTNNFDVNACVQAALDTTQYTELYHECVLFLRNTGDDDAKLTKINQLGNVVNMEIVKSMMRLLDVSFCMCHSFSLLFFSFFCSH